MQTRYHNFWVLCVIATVVTGCWRPPIIQTYSPLPENLPSDPVLSDSNLTAMADVYVVQRGDTAYAIARCLHVDLKDLVVLNSLVPPYMIQVGEAMLIPSDARFENCRATRRAGTAAINSEGSVDSGVNDIGVHGTLVVSPPAVAADQYTVIPATPPRAATKFLWPVTGEVISDFGPKPGRLRNDGINIAAPIGTEVRAAENGVVAYAGNELRGYGKMLLIRHQGGWITAYAHNKELLVKQGALVARGDVIARVGKSGSVDRPQTHFEIRKGEKAVDPKSYLSWK